MKITHVESHRIHVPAVEPPFWTVGRRLDSAGGLTAVQLDEPVQARYIRVIADHPDDGGQTGGQMAISELGAYSGS